VYDEEEDVSLETECIYSVEEELKGLAVALATLDRHGLLTADILSKLSCCQRELRAQKLAEMKQTTITDHFKTPKT